MPGCQNKTDAFLTLLKHSAEVIGTIGFGHIFGNLRDQKCVFYHRWTSKAKKIAEITCLPSSLLVRCRPSSRQRSLLMWPGPPWAMSQEGEKKKSKRQEKRKKKVKKKDLIHSHRCVTPLLPQQKFTTELMTKGRAPMQPIVAWRTMWRLWKANPSAPLTGWAFKQTWGPISPLGWVAVWQRWENLGRSPPPSPRPERWLGRHCEGRILSPLSGRGRLCSVTRWCPSEGQLTLTEPVWALLGLVSFVFFFYLQPFEQHDFIHFI